jgi:hypothetical protein
VLFGSGFLVTGHSITAVDALVNFVDAASQPFQLRFNSSDESSHANWLIWNGGTTPVVGTGNTDGFPGATYSFLPSGVPEPATWAMMLAGFAGLGFMGWRGSRKTVLRTA